MAKHFRNISQLGSLLKHSTGQGVPKEVGGNMLGTFDAGLSQAAPDNMANARRTGERHPRGIRPQKDSLRWPSATIQTQIARNGRAGLMRQRQNVPACPLPADQDFTGPPVKVACLKSYDFTSPQPKSGQQKQDGIVAPASGGSTIRHRQHSLHLIWREFLGHTRLAPFSHGRNRRRQIAANFAPQVEKTDKGAQADGQQPYILARPALGAFE